MATLSRLEGTRSICTVRTSKGAPLRSSPPMAASVPRLKTRSRCVVPVTFLLAVFEQTTRSCLFFPVVVCAHERVEWVGNELLVRVHVCAVRPFVKEVPLQCSVCTWGFCIVLVLVTIADTEHCFQVSTQMLVNASIWPPWGRSGPIGVDLTGTAFSEYGFTVMSSFESMSATLSPENWGECGACPLSLCAGIVPARGVVACGCYRDVRSPLNRHASLVYPSGVVFLFFFAFFFHADCLSTLLNNAVNSHTSRVTQG